MDNDDRPLTTDEFVHDTLSKLQLRLSDEDREASITRLGGAIVLYERLLLERKEARLALYALYNEKVKDGRSLAKLSRDFNMHEKGKNQKLSELLQTIVPYAHSEESFSDPTPYVGYSGPKDLLKNARIDFNILLSLREHLDEKHAFIVEDIDEERNRLFRSIVMLAADLAKKTIVHGNVISYEDLVQEALLAAKEAVNSFDPTLKDAPNMFVAYTGRSITGALSKYVAEKSRTVKVPRGLIDRWGPTKAAVGVLPRSSSYEDIAKMATKLLWERRQKSKGAGTKLAKKEVYTAKEVEHLLSVVQDTVPLYPGDPEAMGSKLDPSVEPNQLGIEQTDVKSQAASLIKLHCRGDQELDIMNIRWNNADEEVLGKDETARRYYKETGYTITKNKVASIEAQVFERIRLDPEATALWRTINGS